jgi:2-polyprenyl-3-methyl-5-hydroxy-6-metoxy-1,4-benzoquinol methylase
MQKNEAQDYRQILHSDYTKSLSGGEIYQDNEKQKRLMCRYFNRNYLPYLPKDKTALILDVACGKGHYINACLKNGYANVLGIDLSAPNVAFCREQGYPVEQEDMFEFLPDKAGTYDAILFNDVIEHLHKNEIMAALFLLRGALKENGSLVIKTINAANPYVASAGRYITFDHEIAFTDKSLEQVLRGAGFADIVIRGQDIYVIGGPIALIAKTWAKLICLRLRVLSILFGRKSVRIFTKSIIAFAKK